MIPPKGGKTMSTKHRGDADGIAVKNVEQMKQILEEARRAVKPIVKRESAAEVVNVELLNIRLKNAHRT